MFLILYLISQLLAYSPLNWCVFIGIALIAARTLGAGGVVLGHLVIAAVIFGLDLQWIESEMSKPGWNGIPDRDIGFLISVIIRIILINTTLLPISILACRWRSRTTRQKLSPASSY